MLQRSMFTWSLRCMRQRQRRRGDSSETCGGEPHREPARPCPGSVGTDGIVRGAGYGRQGNDGGEMEMKPEFFLGWADSDPKKPIEEKMAEASARYEDKYGERPDTVMLNPQT